MSGMGSANKIRHIVRIRQMLCRWRKKAATGARLSRLTGGKVPLDVPVGHLAVYVGASRRRFVVRASYLNFPAFRSLLSESESEYGYDYSGPIVIPCDELRFEVILRSIAAQDDGYARDGARSHQHSRNSVTSERRCSEAWLCPETRPLLNGVPERSVR